MVASYLVAAAFVAAASLLALTGCGSGGSEAITTYKVAREIHPPKRMLAALVRRGDTTWFFKLTGDDRAVVEEVDTFVQFVRDLSFDALGKPKSDSLVRAGWIEATGSPQRLATLRKVVGDSVLDFSISSLPTRGDWNAYVLQNINRWRRQLSLPPLAPGELDKQIVRIRLKGADGLEALTVNFVESRRETPVRAAPSELQFEKPAGWKPTANDTFSRFAFTVEDEATDGAAKITVTPLGAAAGRQLLANVNRWRQSLGMPAIDESKLSEVTESIDMLGTKGWLVDLVPEGEGRDGILGAIAVAGDRAWFVKMSGESELLRRQKSVFTDFVKSLRFGERK